MRKAVRLATRNTSPGNGNVFFGALGGVAPAAANDAVR
jgi:hypothetical protein